MDLNQFKQFFQMKRAQATSSPPQMGGMAGQAQKTLQNRAYQLHVQEMLAQGLTPMTEEEFEKSQKDGRNSLADIASQ